MKSKIFILLGLLSGPAFLSAAFTPEVRQALVEACNEAVADLETSPLVPKDQPISLLPIAGDQNRFVEGQLKIALTRAGFTYVEGRNDPLFNEILDEVAWDERKEDMIDPTTITKFGALKSTELLLYGMVRSATANNSQVYAELELHLTSIATKQHLWGDLVARRLYLPDSIQGVVTLDADLRQLLQRAFAEQEAGFPNAAQLGGAGTILVAPLAGDIDGYVVGLAENMIAGAGFTVSRANSPTVAGIRSQLQQAQSDGVAILTGAVRDLSIRLVDAGITAQTEELVAEVQLRIEDAATGNLLWSDTLFAREQREDRMDSKEMLEESKNLIEEYRWPIIIALGALVILFILRRFVKAATRVR